VVTSPEAKGLFASLAETVSRLAEESQSASVGEKAASARTTEDTQLSTEVTAAAESTPKQIQKPEPVTTAPVISDASPQESIEQPRSLKQDKAAELKDSEPKKVVTFSEDLENKPVATPAAVEEEKAAPAAEPQEIYEVQIDYNSKHEKMLKLTKGDRLVKESVSRGWYFGTNLTTGAKGFFLPSFVLKVN
jgi:FtsZ-interacting cell division protein ZipA